MAASGRPRGDSLGLHGRDHGGRVHHGLVVDGLELEGLDLRLCFIAAGESNDCVCSLRHGLSVHDLRHDFVKGVQVLEGQAEVGIGLSLLLV